MTRPMDGLKDLSPEELDLLVAKMRRRRSAGGEETALRPRPRDGSPLPLSFAQERLWFLEQLEPGTATYNIAASLDLRGFLGMAALEQALRRVVERHEGLRTRFENRGGTPVQNIEPAALSLPVVDLEGLEPRARRAEGQRLALALAREPFELQGGGLLRTVVIRKTAKHHGLVLVVHHIVADGGSVRVLIGELAQLYAAALADHPLVLPPLPVQYADFAFWQRERLKGDALQPQLDYWREYLADLPQGLSLPTDRSRPAVTGSEGARRSLVLSADLTGALQRLAETESTTLFTVLLAAWGVCLAWYSGVEDLAVATPVAGRGRRELENLVGLLVNTLVLRTKIEENPTGRELLRRLGGEVAEAQSHDEVPFNRLVHALEPDHSLSHTPLAQVMLAFEAESLEMTLGDLGVTLEDLDTGTAKFDLTLTLRPDGQTRRTLKGYVEYRSDLFDGTTVDRLARHFRRLLEGLAATPELPLRQLPWMYRSEQHQLLEEWNDRVTAPPRVPLLHHAFQERAVVTPDALALVAGEERLSYSELDRRANRLAHRLRDLGVGPEVLVGIVAHRGAHLVVGLLAILKAGGAYVPLDPAYPLERLAWTLEDADVAVLLTESAVRDLLPPDPAPHVLILGQEDALYSDLPDTSPTTTVEGENLAYIIYTSGSTGRPKGVAIRHRAAAELLRWAEQVYSPAEMAGLLAATSVCFDLSVFEIFAPLAIGGTVLLVADALALAELPSEPPVTLINTVPSAIGELLNQGAVPKTVRTVNLAGEALPGSLVRRLYALGTVERVFNLYGPSEDTTYSTGTRVPKDARGEPSIGQPLDNTRAYLLDSQLRSVALGVVGELVLGGENLSRGYLNRPALTAERFVPDPFAPQPGGRMYRTGDLARWGRDGDIDFLGRADHQVKVRGFRVEPAEVEAVLLKHPRVLEVVVVAPKENDGRYQRLVAYLAGPEAEGLEESALRDFLSTRLPAHLVPSRLVTLESLPRTPNGKVDRGALLESRAQATTSVWITPPATPLEELLAGIFRRVLEVEVVGAEDDFFALGGHSLLATRVLAQIRETLGVELPVRSLFETPTVRSLARRVMVVRGREEALEPIPSVDRDRVALPLSFAQQRLWFIEDLGTGSPVYNVAAEVQMEGDLDADLLRRALTEVVRRHEILRTTFEAPGGRPVQVVAEPSEVPLPLVEVASAQEAQDLVTEAVRQPFDLQTGPLLRAFLLQVGLEDHRLVLTLHHIVCDAWSLEILTQELTGLYTSLHRNGTVPPAPPVLQFADFAAWQRRRLQGKGLDRELAFWRQRMDPPPPPLDLPLDRPRPSVQDHAGALLRFPVPASLAKVLGKVCRERGVTSFMAWMAVFQLLLARYSGQADLSVGTPVAYRSHPQLQAMLGFCANTLVVRSAVDGERSFQQHLEEVRRHTLEAFDHQEMPFEKLVEVLEPQRDLARSPLFQALLVVQHSPPRKIELPGLVARMEARDTGTAKFDLTLFVEEQPDGWHASLEYATALLDSATVERLRDHLLRLMSVVLEHPDAPTCQATLLSAAERQELLTEWGGSGAAVEEPIGVLDRVARWLKEQPQALAAVCGEETLTYGELDRRSAALAGALMRLGVEPDQPVAICVERSLHLPVAVLGVQRAGAACLALDTAYPLERLNVMVEDSRAVALVTGPGLAERLPKAAIALPRVELDRLAGGQPGPEGETTPSAPSISGDQLAYLVYTSGSTGLPKGVAVSHRTLANLVTFHQEQGVVSGRRGRTLQFAALSFDVSFQEIFVTLGSGGTLVLISEELRQDPFRLLEVLCQQSVETLYLPFVALQQLAEAALGSEGTLDALTDIITAGEQLRVTPQIRALLDRAAPCRLHNHYGPSETHVATAWSRRIENEDSGGRTAADLPLLPPIGRPLQQVSAVVLDSAGELQPVGIVGEICLGGVGPARGYVDRPAATAERFVPDPFDGFGARLYRTGDLGRWIAAGELEFMGRRDHQVKVRGFRVELGEVEEALNAHPVIVRALVTAHREPQGGTRLVAHIESQESKDSLDVDTLRAFLSERLPDYMIPVTYLPLVEVPLTPSGKVDRLALPAPPEIQTRAGRSPLRTDWEIRLADLWSEVLGVEGIGADDDFFRLGGHSLLATQVVARVRDTFGVELPLRRVFEAPTLSALAAQIARGGAGVATSSILPALNPAEIDERAVPLSFAQERIWFLDQLDPGNPAFHLAAAVGLQGSLDVAALERALNDLPRRHEGLRTGFGEQTGEPHSWIEPQVSLALPMVDLCSLASEVGNVGRDALVDREARRAFDLATPPLARFCLLRMADDEHVLLVTVHHIVADGWSMQILMRELARGYGEALDPQASIGESALDLSSQGSAPPVRYADYAVWQRRWVAEGGADDQLDYWRRQLEGVGPVLDLPTGPRRAGAKASDGLDGVKRAERLLLQLPEDLTDRLRELSLRAGTTLFMTLLAACKVLLYRISGQDEILIGTPVAGRGQRSLEGILGMFLNTLVLRTNLSGSPSFQEVLQRVRQTSLGATGNQDVPFELLLEELAPERDPDRTPFFRVFFNMLNFSLATAAMPGLTWEELPSRDAAAKFDLTIYAREQGKALRLDWVYRADRFHKDSMRILLEQLRYLLEQVTAEPDRSVESLSLLTSTTRSVLPDPTKPLESRWPGSVVERFLTHAESRPEALAVVDAVDGHGTWTYGDLERESRILAAALMRGGVEAGDLVALHGERGAPLVAAVLGVWRARAAFVMLDPDYPGIALADRLRQASPAAWIQWGESEPSPEVAAVLADLPTACRLRYPVVVEGELKEALQTWREPSASEADALAYLAFTSGSTGGPKGILGDHRPISHFLAWHCQTFDLGAEDRFSLLSGLSHDPLLRDLCTPLWLGGALVVPQNSRMLEPGWLSAWLRREGVTVAHLTPAIGTVLSQGDRQVPSALRWAFFGGDRLTRGDLGRFQLAFPGAQCVNFYGTTETPQAMGWSRLEAAPAGDSGETIPMGLGIDGAQLLVVGKAGEPAGIGELGEIYIRTPYLARGYLHDGASTETHFLANPWGRGESVDPEDRVYKTGDMGRYQPDGQVLLLGRRDGQMNLRGYRVEPGEVVARLLEHQAVTAAQVMLVGDDPSVLVAFLMVEGDAPTDTAQWRTFLQVRLPRFMIPSRFLVLESMPLTPNRKVDRRALRNLAAGAIPGDVSRVAPRTSLEERMSALWREVLEVEAVGVEDDFFALGGHSLLATRLMGRIRQEMGITLGLRCLFEAPTVAALAARVEEGEGQAEMDLPTITPDTDHLHEPFALTDIQQAYWVGRTGAIELGNVASHRYMEVEGTEEELSLDRLTRACRRLVERHDMLRAIIRTDGKQVILENVPPYEIGVEDLRSATSEESETRLQELREELSHQMMDIGEWPLFEVRAARIAGDRIRLFLSFDYLIADAWSFRILLGELLHFYEDLDATLPPLEMSFRDYVRAEQDVRQSAIYRKSQEYWQQQVEDLPPGPDLPFAQDPAQLKEQRFRRRFAQLSREDWQRIKKRAVEAGITSSALLLTVFGEILATWSRSERFSVVLTLFHRLPVHPEVNRLVGDFTSTTLLVLDSPSGASFVERARNLQKRLWSDLDHRYVSGVEVVRELGRARGRQARVATPIVFTSTLDLPLPEGVEEKQDLPGQVIYTVSQTPQVLLDHQVTERAGALHLSWDAVEAIFPAGMLDEMFEAYCNLLRRLAAESWDHWTAGTLLPEVQYHRRRKVNDTGDEVPAGLLHEPALAQARRRPQAPAVICGSGETLTYGELDARSAKLATALCHEGVRPESLVAVLQERGWQQVVAVVAILRAGAAYLPLDPGQPGKRLDYLLEVGQVDVALVREDSEGTSSNARAWPEAVRRLPVPTDALPVGPQQASEPTNQGADSDHLAYVIFTSGSTGEPKGVMIEHRQALNTCLDINRRYGVGERDRVLALSSLNFDLSVYDIFGLLAAGGTVVVPEPGTLRDPARWLELLREAEVTVWNTVPALMEMLVHHLEGTGESLPPSLRLVMMSGDWIPVRLPDRIRALAPEQRVEVISLGGATEGSIWSILYPVEEVASDWQSIPYGRPLDNQRFHVFNRALRPCPEWVPGDLYIGGAGVARGYWRSPILTARSFVPHPESGERLYRTGDLGRYLPDGNIEFLGREDFQVKVQGFRIEMGEIEAALARHPDVRIAAVTALGDLRGPKTLVGYIAPMEGAVIDSEALRRDLAAHLPGYMVPQTLMVLERMPLTDNGKVDRRALPRPDAVAALATDGDQQPRNEIEAKLVEIFSEVVEQEPLGIHEDFFTVGGNSVSAILLISRVRDAFQVELPLEKLFTAPTVAGLAEVVLQSQIDQQDDDEMAALLAELEGMSDEQAALLLAQDRAGDES